jgi:hypothetical protein
MKLVRKLKRLLCFFGIHDWKFYVIYDFNYDGCECSICGKERKQSDI